MPSNGGTGFLECRVDLRESPFFVIEKHHCDSDAYKQRQ